MCRKKDLAIHGKEGKIKIYIQMGKELLETPILWGTLFLKEGRL